MKELTIQTFKEWLNVAIHSKKYRTLRFLSVADFYRQLTGKEPRYKNPERYAFDYNKPFREWAKNIWKPFLGENYEKLGITNVSVSRSGLPLLFKPKKIKTLLDCMPKEFRLEFFDTRAFEFKDVKVIREHRAGHNFIPFPGKHKHVYYWVELENGYAVGWNENPSRGWSFPVVRISYPRKYCNKCKTKITVRDRHHRDFEEDGLCLSCREISLLKMIGEMAKK